MLDPYEENPEIIGTKPVFELIKLIPLITLIILSAGVLDLFIYYKLFHINILAFLDLAELLPLTLSDMMDILLAMCCLFTIAVFTNSKINKQFVPKKLEGSRRNKLSVQYLFAKNNILQALCDFCIILDFVLTICCSPTLINFMNYSEAVVIFILSLYISLWLLLEMKKVYSNISNRFEFLFILSLILMINSSYSGYKKYIDVKFGNAYHASNKTYIIFNKETITSNDSYYYIGKTKFNILFYDEHRKSVDFYPVSAVTKLSLTDW